MGEQNNGGFEYENSQRKIEHYLWRVERDQQF